MSIIPPKHKHPPSITTLQSFTPTIKFGPPLHTTPGPDLPLLLLVRQRRQRQQAVLEPHQG